MSLPLEGVRVAEYAQYVAGPLCGLLLAELGAEVVKVEPPAGDGYRRVMPVAPELGRFFVPLNRGKRSVVIDLRSHEGRAQSEALVDTADIVLHNLPPRRELEFGLAWDAVRARRPGAVLGVVTSFGHAGPLAGAPAYDLVAQARAGLLTAHASPGDDVPVRAGGIPMADLAAGMLLATSVLAAFAAAVRSGEGRRVEASLLQAALAVQVQDLVWLADEPVGDGSPAGPADLGRRAAEIRLGLDTNPYYRCFQAADGYLAVACLNVVQRRALLGLLGLDDPTVEAPDIVLVEPDVLEQKRRLTTAVEHRVAADPVEAWTARLAGVGVPCGPVLARDGVPADPQVVAGKLLQSFEQPGLGTTTTLSRLVAGGASGPAPLLGADTEAVLAEVAV